MVAKKTRKAAVSTIAAVETEPTAAELRGFFDGGGQFDNFSFARWRWVGEGPRSGLAEKIAKKRFPVPPVVGAEGTETAAKTELILPAFAPAEYISLDFFLRRYEEMQPAHEVNAYLQVNFAFPNAINLHHPAEMVRTFAKGYFVDEREMAVFLAAHAPWVAGSSNTGHLHLLVFPRRLRFAFGEFDHRLASDQGNRDVHEAWSAFQKEWFQLWPRSLVEFG